MSDELAKRLGLDRQKRLEEAADKFLEAERQLRLGATGKFPEGKLTPDDEGEIRIAIGADESGNVVIDFGKPVKWIGFNAEQALQLAASLRAKAHAILAAQRESDGKRKHVCLNLDGVLAHYEGWKGYDHIGDPRPGAVEFTKKLAAIAQVVIFTTRCKADFADRPEGATPESLRAHIQAWLDRHGFAYHEVYVGQGKPIAAAYVDDRNVHISSNPSEDEFAAALDAIRCLL